MSLSLFDVKQVGKIAEIHKMILRVKGLGPCAFGQPVDLGRGLLGMIIGFDSEMVDVLAFSDIAHLKSGDSISAKLESFKVPVGDEYIGRVVSALGEALDGGEAIRADACMPAFGEAPSMIERNTLSHQIATGTLVLDACIPIAKGQRELVIGDRMTGKSTLAIDAILNQKNKKMICIYCSIGRNQDSLQKTVQFLEKRNAMEYTIVVAGTADMAQGQQFLAPYTAATLGEYFMRRGQDVLVVFDDMTKHAWTYRQISLLLERSPGREAYPGDIFYIHSQLVERAAQLSEMAGGGSMTFLPIVETQQGDLTGYISSNLISMTDGQIYLSTDLFKEGMKPAIDLGLSVSRIGNKIQSPTLKHLASSIRLDYVRYRELLGLTKLRSGVTQEVQQKLSSGLAVQSVLQQAKNEPIDLAYQICLLSILRSGQLDGLPTVAVRDFRDTFARHLANYHAEMVENLEKTGLFTESMKQKLGQIARDYLQARMHLN